MIAGLFGLDPMPRKRALLNLRAVNSVKCVFGARIAASLTTRTPRLSSTSFVTAVTLSGSDRRSAGSFCAVTVTGGRPTRSSGSSAVWAGGVVCCAAAGSRDQE